jgi:hypothetical protein
VESDSAQEPSATETVEQAQQPLTEAAIRKLRGQYFTVRHIPLVDCGHKMDVINEPRHRNCENCWWQWFNFHPQLVSTVDEAWRENGKEFVIRLRGKHFAKMFGRFMQTVVALKEEEKNANQEQSIGGIPESGGVPAGPADPADQSGENQSSTDGGEGPQ